MTVRTKIVSEDDYFVVHMNLRSCTDGLIEALINTTGVDAVRIESNYSVGIMPAMLFKPADVMTAVRNTIETMFAHAVREENTQPA